MNARHARPVVASILSLITAVALSAELPSAVVDTAWLGEHLSDENVRILDVRSQITDYWLGHIPGAVYLNADALRMADHGVPVMLLDTQLLADKLGIMGIARDDAVVIYTETGDYKAPFVAWALEYVGHGSFGVMEGGFGKWQAEGLPVTQDYPMVTPTQYSILRDAVADVRAGVGDVAAALDDDAVARVDVRATPLYTGDRGFWKRNGHVPGFKGHFWGDDLRADGTWKSVEELRQTYAELGVTPDKRILVMCGQGLMSAHAYFTLKYVLGFPNVTNYDGGFHEWVADDTRPVATGME